MSKKILITGHDGYIGSVLAPYLVEHGYFVAGLDTEYFHPCLLGPERLRIPAVRKDIRDVAAQDLEGFEAVIHLAALSNDPIGNLNSRWTNEINLESTVRLARFAKQAGVRRFLFAVVLHHVWPVGGRVGR